LMNFNGLTTPLRRWKIFRYNLVWTFPVTVVTDRQHDPASCMLVYLKNDVCT